MRAAMSVRAPRQTDYKTAPPGGALNLNVQHIRAAIKEAAEEARGWAPNDLPLLTLPVGSTKRKFAADTIHERKLQRRSELDADRVASAASALQSNLDRLLEQSAEELVDAESWDSALKQVLDTSVRGGMEPIQVWWMCKAIIEQWGSNNERRARVANVVDGWYSTDVFRRNLTRLLEQPDADFVNAESCTAHLRKRSVTRIGKAYVSTAWEVQVDH